LLLQKKLGFMKESESGK
jgi:hypothetical protein